MHKILIITNDLHIGGIQKSLIDFLKFLVSLGHKIDLLIWEEGILSSEIPASVQVIKLDYATTWKNIKKENDFRKKMIGLASHLKYKFYGKILRKPWQFFPRMTQHYNTVISYTQNGYPRFYAIDLVSADQKYLWYHHGSYDLSGSAYDLDKEYFKKFTKLITVSSSNKIMLERYFPEYIDRIQVIPNMINVDEIRQRSKEETQDFMKEEGVFSFVTVSRFSKEKGLDLAIDVATELVKQGLRFKWYFVGDGETFFESLKVLKERGLQEICIFLGTKTNPYPYVASADLYIQTSYVESQSITVIEALVLKKLIVTTDLPALREVLENGRLGVLCKPEVKAFAEKITNLLQDQTAQATIMAAVKVYTVSNEAAHRKINELLN